MVSVGVTYDNGGGAGGVNGHSVVLVGSDGVQEDVPLWDGREGKGRSPTGNGRRVSSVVEHSSANPKVPGSIPGPVSYRGHGL